MSIRTDNPGWRHKGPGRLYSHGLPRPYPLSATWWIYVEDRQAAGYFTAFAYGPSTFGGTDYYTAAGVRGEWSCGAHGTDSTTGVQIAENRWWRQGFRCRRLADNSVQHEFFYDLPSTSSRANNVDAAFNYFQTVGSTHFLRWADVEWSPNETLIGRIGGIKIWNAYLPHRVLAAEAMSHQIVCPEWAPYLWAHIPLRHRDDLLDWSGKGRRFYYPAYLPTTIADPPLIIRQRTEAFGALIGAGGSTYNVSITETVAASDSVSALAVLIAQLSEAAAASDSVTGSLSIQASISETVTASDAVTAALSIQASVTESASAGDSVSAQLDAVGSVLEAASASDSVSSSAVFVASISESGNASDSVGIDGNVYAMSIAESATAGDSYSAQLVAATGITESVIATDALSAQAVLVCAVEESAAASDAVSSQLDGVAGIAESAAAGDSYSASGGAPQAPQTPPPRAAMQRVGGSMEQHP